MNNLKKQHLIQKLRDRGHFEEAERVLVTDHDDLDFATGTFAGFLASELLSDFSYAEPEIGADTPGDYSGGGGISDGGGAGGDF